MHRALVLVALLVGVVVVAAPPPSAAKEGVQARIATPISLAAAPGSRVTVVWTLSFADRDARRAFSADSVFIRLFGAPGSRSPRVYASQPSLGRFRATVRIPAGGVRRVVIGLMGTGGNANGCRPSPHLFRIVGPVLR
jgi:hypothetical protein